jgi:Flp pilus assembly protein CpaB
MRQGEPFTDARLVGAPLLRGYGDGLVAAPVRIADAGAVALVATGDLVDVLAAESAMVPGQAGTAGAGSATLATPARVVASAARVVAIPRPTGDGSSIGPLAEGALVVLATTPDIAADLARAAVTARLSLTLRTQ